MKVMLDTNVLVSAFATRRRGVCADVLAAVLARHDLVVGHNALVEFERVLVEKMAVPTQRARKTIAFLANEAEVIRPIEPAAWPMRDP